LDFGGDDDDDDDKCVCVCVCVNVLNGVETLTLTSLTAKMYGTFPSGRTPSDIPYLVTSA